MLKGRIYFVSLTIALLVTLISYKVLLPEANKVNYSVSSNTDSEIEQIFEERVLLIENEDKPEDVVIQKSEEIFENKNVALENNVEVVEPIVEEVKPLHFNENAITEVSNVTEADLNIVLEGTGLQELSPYYVEAEKLYGVNALFIVAISAHESAWGTSDRAIYDNNYTGFGVYADSSEGINAETKRENIINTAKCLKELYLTEGALYHNGYSIYSINISYALNSDDSPNLVWGEGVTMISYEIYDSILEIRE